MKKSLVLFLCFFAFFIFGCKKQTSETPIDNGAGKTSEEKAVVPKALFIMGLDDSFPPMGFRDAANRIVGFDIDLAREVSGRIGRELVLQPIDWASKEMELNNGKIDCIWNGLSVDSARLEAMLLSKPYLANRMIIVVKNNSPIVSKSEFKGKEIGAQAGSTAVKAFKKDTMSGYAQLHEYENNVLALTDLRIGRIDGIVMDEVVARYLITKNNGPYKILDDSLGSEEYAVAFKKGNTALAAEVEKALEDMAADGTSDNISNKWFGAPIVLK